VMLEVYPAGEEPIPGADSRSLCRAIRSRGMVEPILVTENEKLPRALLGVLDGGDVLLTQGAGDIGRMAAVLAGGALALGGEEG